MLPIIIIFIIIFVAVIFYFKRKTAEAKNKWEQFPTVSDYIENKNPTKGKGISCYKCGSHNIWESGFKGLGNEMRLHYCKQCKTNLYRSKN